MSLVVGKGLLAEWDKGDWDPEDWRRVGSSTTRTLHGKSTQRSLVILSVEKSLVMKP